MRYSTLFYSTLIMLFASSCVRQSQLHYVYEQEETLTLPCRNEGQCKCMRHQKCTKPLPLYLLCMQCIRDYGAGLLALAALIYLLCLIHVFNKNNTAKAMRLNPDDLAVLKVIKVNASALIDKHSKKSKVVIIDKWRDG